MERTTDCVVVGGGVIGCAVAYFLGKRGVRVTLLERGEIGAQASGAAAGIFSLLKPLARIDDYERLLLASLSMFPSLVQELTQASGLDLEYRPTDTLRTSRTPDPKRTRRLQRWAASCRAQGLEVQLLDGTETHALEPLLSPDIQAATLLPGEGQVRAQRVVAAFASAAEQQGARLCPGTEVVGIRHAHGRVTAVETGTGDVIACGQLVIATGAWAAQAGTWLHLDLPVIPQRGQVLALRQPEPPLHHTIIGEGIYLAPKADGTLIVGASKEEVGFDASVTAGGVLELLAAAVRLVPALRESVFVRTWAGLRPKTPDNQPILGRVAAWENVALACGHNSFGILLSAITGQCIADLLTTGDTPELIRPFSLARFTEPSVARAREPVEHAEHGQDDAGEPE